MHDMGVLHLLRLIHVIFGAFWLGAALFIAWFLMPSLRAVGPAGGAVMEQLAVVRRLPIYLMAAAILTILSGIALYWRDSNGFGGAWMRSGPGVVFGFGGAVGIVVVVLGMAVVSPTATKLGALAAQMRSGGPPPPDRIAEMQMLQARLARMTRVVSLLLVVATGAMAVARYVP